MTKHKIIFGVCGIGRGHTSRQLPIISHFLKNSKIVVFAFNESYNFLKKHFANNKNIKVFSVIVPWIHGGEFGIDYKKTATEKFNEGLNVISQNFMAMSNAEIFLSGKADLVISDYEPTAAQYAYSRNIPLIIIDQQSKYFYDGYPDKIDDLGFLEERSRLGLFFPKANMRIACSFFRPPLNKIGYGDLKIKIVPTIIRDDIVKLKKSKPRNNNDILVYLSSYSKFVQTSSEVISILSKFKNHNFYLFISKKSDFASISERVPDNIKIYFQGDKIYLKILTSASAAICTAGHMFISEMMFLNKPVYAVPLQTYEQKYNAKIINDNEFGIRRNNIKLDSLKYFLSNINAFKDNIVSDKKVLLSRESGTTEIIALINKQLKIK
ncbi:MAG: glycosyltransferase [Candidatus Staskawiczbacteria bacterium]|nr:glycosyltransferase [Candidatus Staskawiczbacteria bacterium]